MMLKRWIRTVALLLAVLFCLSSCSKAEKVDYDTNPINRGDAYQFGKAGCH